VEARDRAHRRPGGAPSSVKSAGRARVDRSPLRQPARATAWPDRSYSRVEFRTIAHAVFRPAVRDTLAVAEVDPRGTRVIVADDDVLMREGLASLLEGGGYEVVGRAGDGSELLRLARECRPDLAVIDIRMPPEHRTEGLEAAHLIRKEFPETAILLLSAHVEVAQAMTLLASGRGSGYLLKARVTELDEFLDAVGRVSRGGSVVDPQLVQELVTAREVGDPLEELTPREREVLALMAEGRSNAGIARRLWIAEGTVERHVHSIMMKLTLPESDDDHRRVLAAIRFLDAHQTGSSHS
jgi:DNA-binding NarL/FixJ family response regulator